MQATTRNHRITKAEAVAQTGRYRKQKENVLADAYKGKGVLPQCETFDRGAFDDLLRQKECTGIRIYYAMNEKDDVHLVIVGVDVNGNDILPASDTATLMSATEAGAPEEGIIIENGVRCPDTCPPVSPLNS